MSTSQPVGHTTMAARTAMSSDLYAEGHFEVEAWNANRTSLDPCKTHSDIIMGVGTIGSICVELKYGRLEEHSAISGQGIKRRTMSKVLFNGIIIRRSSESFR